MHNTLGNIKWEHWSLINITERVRLLNCPLKCHISTSLYNNLTHWKTSVYMEETTDLECHATIVLRNRLHCYHQINIRKTNNAMMGQFTSVFTYVAIHVKCFNQCEALKSGRFVKTLIIPWGCVCPCLSNYNNGLEVRRSCTFGGWQARRTTVEDSSYRCEPQLQWWSA